MAVIVSPVSSPRRAASTVTSDGRRRFVRNVAYVAPDTYADAPVWFFVLFVVSILVRDGVSGYVLSLWVPYTAMPGQPSPGGSIIWKIHPGSYGILICGLLGALKVLPQTKIKGNPAALGCIGLSLTVFLLLGSAYMLGNTSGLSFLIDTILVAPVSLFALARLSVRQRLWVARWVIGLYLVNAGIVFAEFILREHLVFYPFQERSFRPGGLFGHPLLVGLMNVCVIPSIFLFAFSSWLRWTLVAILSMTVLVAQARVASVVVLAMLPVLLFLFYQEGMKTGKVRSTTVLVGSLCSLAVVPIIGLIFLQTGVLDRLLGGFNDDSTMARVTIYQVFKFFTPQELLLGTDLLKIQYYAKVALGLPYIESPVVVYVAQFGIIGGALFACALIYFYTAITIRAPLYTKLAVVSFLVVAVSNNTLSSKGPSVVTETVLTFIAATIGASRRIRQEMEAAGQGGAGVFVRTEQVQLR